MHFLCSVSSTHVGIPHNSLPDQYVGKDHLLMTSPFHADMTKHPQTLFPCSTAFSFCSNPPAESPENHNPYILDRQGFGLLLPAVASGRRLGSTSWRLYHWATGLRGFSSISNQWSRAVPTYPGPTTKHPINSLLPTLQ